VLERMERFRQLDPDLIDVLGGSAKVGVFGIGVVTALGTVGIDVTALVAGLGLTGFALGLALKDIISNAISGILVILYKPIKHKDFISVSGFQGQVVEINLRYTVLQGPDTTIFVPNSTLFSSGITVQREVEGGTAPEKDQ
jgi:small conductance mechanosensitive channel